MSATIVAFPSGERRPRFPRSTAHQRDEARALRDARLIRDASKDGQLDGDSWLQAAFLALLKVMDADQRRAFEAMLAIRAVAGEDKAAETALAIVRFKTGTPEHCRPIADMLARMGGAS